MAPARQTPANKNILPWKFSTSMRSGRYLSIINTVAHKTAIESDTPKSFNLSGITSEMMTNGSDSSAHDEMNTQNEKLASGTQLYGCTL